MTEETGPLDEHEVTHAKKPKIKLPKGFDTEAAFLDSMRKNFSADVTADKLNRDAALEDLQFMVGEQWNSDVRARREAARKPVLTINRLPAYVAQIVGNRRLNETTIKVAPDTGGEKQTAEVREDLIRSIQKLSKADQAYDKALESQVVCGIGNFGLALDWTDDDVFTQQINITTLPDALSVVWDRTLVEPTGADAKHCFVIEKFPLEDFKARWPWATPADAEVDEYSRNDIRINGWMGADDVRVVAYWRMITKTRQVALLNDGKVVDITNKDALNEADLFASIQSRPDGTPYIREIQKKFAEMYLCSGLDILEGPYTLPISRVPVFRVPAWEIRVGEFSHRWGLVRFLKDPQRMHNFWRSAVAEKLALNPRAKWIATEQAVAGREDEWRAAHISDDPLLIWNGDSGQAPVPAPPAPLEQAMITEHQMAVQDMRDVSNLHEANLGMPSNEVSGKAILARQRIGDLGTVLYHDNLNAAIAECGKVIDELIPTVYDTPRVVKVLGVDGKDKMQAINDMSNPDSVDITMGKYAVTLYTGPSYITKRVEAAESMMNLINAMPQVVSVAPDLIVEAQDWPGAEKIAKRLRRSLPPTLLDPEDMTPEEQQAAAAHAQETDAQNKIAMQAAAIKAQNLQSGTTLNNARAQREVALANKAGSDTEIASANVSSEIQARAHKAVIETVKAAEGK